MTTSNGRSITAPQLEGAVWKKSSYSGNSNGQCVEVAALTATPFVGKRGVRDSKDPEGPALLFTPEAFNGFIAAVKRNEFDAP